MKEGDRDTEDEKDRKSEGRERSGRHRGRFILFNIEKKMRWTKEFKEDRKKEYNVERVGDKRRNRQI